MIRKISAALSLLLLMCMVIPLDNHFFSRILQPKPALAQDVLVLEEFALYSRREITLDDIGESSGNIGSNGSIDIKKGASGAVIGSLQAAGDIKNEAEIAIYGNVTARTIEDKGALSVSGQRLERTDLAPLTLPTLTFSSAGPDLEVPETSSRAIAPGSYGRLKVKKGASIAFSSGTYYFVKFELDESAALNLDVSGGAIHINVIDKIKFKKNVAMQIYGGPSDRVIFNYQGTDRVKVEDHAVLRGILTAPSAKVEFKKGSRLAGAAYADSIHLAKGASFQHYAAGSEGRPPTADAGGFQTALAGGLVELDGSGSSDPDGDPITYHWSFVSYPDGSSPALSDPADPMPTFTANRAGVYVIELSVSDGTHTSLKDIATVTAVSKVLDATDFVLYADDEIKMDEISGGLGHVGTNQRIRIEKGPSGTIAGDLHVVGRIKNDGEITIAGDVITNSQIDDHGTLTVTGATIENAALAPRMIPPLSFSAEGPDLKVPESAAQTLAPGTYGRVEVKKGATLHFYTGPYFLRELKTDDAAVLTFDVAGGGIELNVVNKLELGKDADLQITGGGTRAVLINYAGKKEVEIEDRGVLRGTLVAPKARVEFEKDSRLEGAVYARKIYLDPGVGFQFHAPSGANKPPVATGQSIHAAEDVPVSITLKGSDPDGDALTFAVMTQPLHGTLAGSAPDLTYTPDANFSGADGFSFTVNDGNVDSDPATVSITIAAVNDAPVADAQNFSLNEDESKAVVLTGFDVEGDVLSYAIVEQPTHGTLVGSAPDLTYTPNENYNGADSFTFKANDGQTDSQTAAVSIAITPVNDAPVANAQSLNLNEDESKTVVLTAFDVEGDSLSYAIVEQPTNGTLSGSAPDLIYTPHKDYKGTDSFSFKVNDGTVDSDPATVNITVWTANDAPVANSQSISLSEDETKPVTLSGFDAEGDTLRYAIVDRPTHGTLSGSAPDLIYTPNVNFSGTDAFSFTVNDGTVDSEPATVSITVTAVNDAPVADAQSINLNEDESQPVILTAFDVEGDLLSYALVEQPANGTLSGTAPHLTYTPNENFNGVDVFSFTVNDGTVDSEPAAVNITVAAVNDPPVAGAGPDRDVLVFDTVVLDGSGSTDVDGDNLTYEWAFVSRPTASAAVLSYPGYGTAVFLADIPGSYEIQLIVDDGAAKSASDSVVITADYAPFSVLETKMMAGDAKAGGRFGTAVAMDGDTAIAGTGSAYIYQYDGSVWIEQAKLTAADELPDDHFGAAVSISSDIALVGAYGNDNDGADSGAAYIFTFDGAYWTQMAKLTAADPAAGDHFGGAVAIGQNRALVGAAGDDDNGADSGSAYVFNFDGTAWIQQAKLTATDAEAGDGFGAAISMSADGVMVGAAGDDDNGADAGAAYFFKLVNSDWTQLGKLVADDGAPDDGFGASLAVSDRYSIVGAAGDDDEGLDAGAAYIFVYDGLAWTQAAKLSASDGQPGDRFGAAVAISGSYAAVGAPGSDDGGQDAGAVYLFKFDGTAWIQQAKMVAGDSGSGDVFGSALALDGANVFAGASGNDEGGQEAGALYVFSIESYHSVSLSAEPETVALGGTSTLSWHSVNVSTATLEPGSGQVPLDGSLSVSPTETTTYTITATGPYGSVSDNVTILVYDSSVSVTVNASAEPADLQPGQTATLTWQTANAVSCIIEPGIGPVDLNGSITVAPTETTIYTVTAANPSGATTKTVTVTVNHPLPAISISAQPGTIDSGGSATLTWSSSDAESVSIDHGIGDVELNGSITLSPPETTIYTFTATGPGGTAIETVTITVIPPLSSSEVKVTAADGASVSFGNSVSVSGDYAILGDYGQDDSTGSAYIFKREGSDWLQQFKLSTGDADQRDYFGWSVSISGDYAIVGAYGGGDYTGAVYIYKREWSSWYQQAILTANDAAANDRFGISVFISGDFAIVGSSGDDDDGSSSGSAYIFKRDGSNWTQQAKLTAEGAAAYDSFGSAVSISGDYAIVGADGDDDGAGAAYIFKRDGSNWTQQAKLTAEDAAAWDEFGSAVSISGDYAIVGADGDGDYSGAAYIFKRDGSNWTQQAKLTDGDAAASYRLFGSAVSISGDYAMVGAHADDDFTGSAYIFKRDGASWRQRDKLTAADAAEYDSYGRSVFINGADAVVGAPGKYNDDQGNSGAVYFYALPTPAVTISADPAVIQTGGTATLAWTSEDAISAVIEPGVGDVALEGKVVVQPTETTTYIIKATGAEGPATDTVTVYVYDPDAPITVSAAVDSAIIRPGQSSNLTWRTTNAVSCVIEPDIGPVDPSGIITLSPPETTTYTITAANPSGTATETVTVVVFPLATISEMKVTAGDAAPDDNFGISAAMSGDYAIVGAYGDDNRSGSAYIIKREGSIWLQQAKLIAGDAAPDDFFGRSVSISGDYAIVGASGDDDHGDLSGAAYIFKRDGSTWNQQAKLTVGHYARDYRFGFSVAISGDYAIVGAMRDATRGSDSGAVYIFRRDGSSWPQQAKLIAGDTVSGDLFGWSVAISGDYVLAAALGDVEAGRFSGSAYIFKRDGSSWLQQDKLVAGDNASNISFGETVAISEDYAVVGAYGDDDGGQSSGAAYIFKRDGSSWPRQAKLTAEDAAAYDYFGWSVAISGDYVMAGARRQYNPGAAYLFKLEGANWKQTKLTAAEAAYDDQYGSAVSISGAYALVGSPEDDDHGSRSGAVYFYILPAPNAAINADPAVVPVGGTTTLSWTSEDADSCVIEPGIGGVGAQGSTVVQPTATTTYSITAAGALDTATDTATVHVYDPNAPITLSAAADPASIQGGQSTTLTWNATNATSCVIEPGIGPVDVSGSITLSPAETTTYTITAANPVATTTETVTISVNYLPAAVSISASPRFIESGETSTLTWSATNATSCVIEPGIGPVDLNGSITVSPTETTTYTIRAANPGDTAVETVTVSLIIPPSISGFKVTASDHHEDDYFGRSVAISGDYAIISAHGADVGGEDTGSAYIFVRGGSGWVQQAKLTASDAAPEDQFGFSYQKESVAISGDYAIVGVHLDDDHGNRSGSAYIFMRQGSSWVQQAKLTAGDAAPEDNFGASVAISGDYAIIGAWGDDYGYNNYSGSAYIFKRAGSTWTQQAKISAVEPVPSGYFGTSVSISGDYAIIGAQQDGMGSFLGCAYIFKRVGEFWIQETKLVADERASFDNFGNAVSISGDYALVGASGDDDSGSSSGSAYIFRRESYGWIRQAKLTAADSAASDFFGTSVSISGDYAVVGASGDDEGGSNSGAAYVFSRDGSDWVQRAKLYLAGGFSNEAFGNSVSISGRYAVVGVPGDSLNDLLDHDGSAYFYSIPDPSVAVSAAPEAVQAGQAATLTWESENAYTCFIEPAVGEVAVDGSVEVMPTETTTYTITATGAWGTAEDRVTVYVYDPGVTITLNAAADPANIQSGQSTTLTWSSTNATSCVIEPGIGNVPMTGSITVTPDATTTYTIIVSNPAGSVEKTVTVVVTYPPPTVNISADPAAILLGESSTLAWQTTHATACVIEPGIGTVDISGTIPILPTQTTTYTITADGPGGLATETVTVIVTNPPPVATIRVEPANIREGESATLIWETSHAQTVAIDQGIGSVAASGSLEVSPAATTTYTLTADGHGGSTSAQATIEVKPLIRTRIRYQYDSAGRIIQVIREQLP